MGYTARLGARDDDGQLLVAQLAATSRHLPEASGTVHVESDDEPGVVLHLSFESGRLVERRVDDRPAKWALVRPGSLGEPWSALPVSAAAFRNWGLRAGTERRSLPPLDEVRSEPFASSPDVRDADLGVRIALAGTPAGVVRLELAYVAGQRDRAAVVDEFTETVEPVAMGAATVDLQLTWRK
ncbi:MAG: hypothetical protein ACKOYM_01765, partial [Actinomycetes bacterium]